LTVFEQEEEAQVLQQEVVSREILFCQRNSILRGLHYRESKNKEEKNQEQRCCYYYYYYFKE
jgi:dTDP-4-dehydrorhamnose 3,5-epimerase-like enzyme